jgi:anti-sigma B factor antagonist
MPGADPPPFSVDASTSGDVLVLAVTGEVDMATAPELARAIGLVSDHARGVVVDFSDVTFLDSSGLNALVRGQRELAGREVSLSVVVPAGSPVLRIFEITQLTDSLAVVGSVDEALR